MKRISSIVAGLAVLCILMLPAHVAADRDVEPKHARAVTIQGRIVHGESFCDAGSFLIVRIGPGRYQPVRCAGDSMTCHAAGFSVGHRAIVRGGIFAGVLFADAVELRP